LEFLGFIKDLGLAVFLVLLVFIVLAVVAEGVEKG
jgi:hypothetical protein